MSLIQSLLYNFQLRLELFTFDIPKVLEIIHQKLPVAKFPRFFLDCNDLSGCGIVDVCVEFTDSIMVITVLKKK
jgi:hypothetical protein